MSSHKNKDTPRQRASDAVKSHKQRRRSYPPHDVLKTASDYLRKKRHKKK